MEGTSVNYLATSISLIIALFNVYWGVHLKSRMDRQNREFERRSAQLYSKRFSIINDELWPATLVLQTTCGEFTEREPESIRKLEAAITKLKKVQMDNLPFLTPEIESAVNNLCGVAAAERFDENDYPRLKESISSLVLILRGTME